MSGSKLGKYMCTEVMNVMMKLDSVNRSPNNIRCVVFSPEGVIVQFHKVCGGEETNNIHSMLFDKKKAYECLISSDYESVTHSIIKAGLCQNIENIVYCVRDNLYGATLQARDWDIKLLVPSGSTDELHKRYKRLDSILLSGMTISGWYSFLMNNQSPVHVLSEYGDIVRQGQILKVGSDDWTQQYTLRGSDYPPERQGGTLEKHLREIANLQPASTTAERKQVDKEYRIVYMKLCKAMRLEGILTEIVSQTGRPELRCQEYLNFANIQIESKYKRPYMQCRKTGDNFEESVALNYDCLTDYYFSLYSWCLEIVLTELLRLQRSNKDKYEDFLNANAKNFSLLYGGRSTSKRVASLNHSLGGIIKDGESSIDASVSRVVGLMSNLLLDKKVYGRIKRIWQQEFPGKASEVIQLWR